MPQSPLPNEADPGLGPADRLPRQRWPRWRIALAYALLFGIAVGSICVIDGHVLKATPAPVPTATTTSVRP